MIRITEMVAAGADYRVIFEELKILFEGDRNNIKTISLLERKFRELESRFIEGTISDDDFGVERLKIFKSILNLEDKAEKLNYQRNPIILFLESLAYKIEGFSIRTRTRSLLVVAPIISILTIGALLFWNYNLRNPKQIIWNMSTTWEPDTGSIPHEEIQNFAKDVSRYTNQRLKINILPNSSNDGWEKNPDSLFTKVTEGKIDALYSVAYNWTKYSPNSKVGYFFASMPFGKKFRELNEWFEKGDGHILWKEYYDALSYNVIPFPLGHTGEQYGGWFKFELKKENLEKLRMRLPKFQGEILQNAGADQTKFAHQRDLRNLLDRDSINAIEWIGPYEDQIVGIDKYLSFKHYYKQGWHEPDAVLELLINKESYETLPAEIQKVIELLTQKYNYKIYLEFQEKNLQQWKEYESDTLDHIITHDTFPKWFIHKLMSSAETLIKEECEKDSFFRKVHDSYYSN